MPSGSGVLRVLYAGGLRSAVDVPASVLESLGPYDVAQVGSEADAIDRLDSGAPDCVVVDADLADGSWRAVVDAVREADLELPVIVVGPDVADAAGADDDPWLGVVEVPTDSGAAVGVSDDSGRRDRLRSTLAIVAAQIDRLVDAPRSGVTPSLAAIPEPAFVYDEGFAGWNEAFGDLLTVDEESLAQRSLADLFECTVTDLARLAESSDVNEVHCTDAVEGRTAASLSVGHSDGQYLCIVEDTSPAPNGRADRSAAAMLDSLLAELPIAIYFKDRQGRHVDVSHYQVGMGHEWAIENSEGKVHHVPEDVVGKTDFDLYPTSRAEDAVAVDEHVMETEDVHVEESEVVTVQEMEEVSAQSVKDLAMTTIKAPWYGADGDVAGVVGVTRNVTEQWSAERRAARADALLDTVETIVETQIRPEFDGPADDPDAGVRTPDSERLERVLADLDLLLGTRHGAESAELVDLGALARDIWGNVEPGDGTLSVETSGLVEAHPTQLRAVLEELFENALRHAGPDAAVVLGGGDDGFFVEDDGPGIPPARRSDVFEYGTTAGGDDRVGGGLALVDAIARSHGWSVEATDGPRDGARVVVSGIDFY